MTSLQSFLSYPQFAPSQSLRSDDLNALRDFLEEQNRVTRAALIGAGIFCGLMPEIVDVPGDPLALQVCISKGVGLSSDGHLFLFDNKTCYGWYREIHVEAGMNPPDEALANLNLPGGLPLGYYYEFFQDGDDEAKITKEKFDLIKDRLRFVLVHDTQTEPAKNCVNPLNPNVGRVSSRIRVIGINIDLDADQLWVQPDEDNRFDKYPCISRVPGKPPLATSSDLTYTWLMSQWKKAIDAGKLQIEAALNGIVDTRQWSDDIDNKYLSAWFPAGTDPSPLAIHSQYLYEHIRDIICAYNEFAESYVFQSDTCACAIDFAGYVVLGLASDPYKLRMPFYQAGNSNDGLNATRYHFFRNRLQSMLGHVSFPDIGVAQVDVDQLYNTTQVDIRISGSSALSAPLGEHAIPYYYGSALKDNWDFGLSNSGRTERIQHFEQGGTYPRHALSKEVAKYDFFRIEGHLGLPLQAVYDKLKELKEKLNLPFQIVCVPLRQIDGGAMRKGLGQDRIQPLAFSDFCKRHTGLEHFGGVFKGGSFIIVFDDESALTSPITKENAQSQQVLKQRVIADFCLPYSGFLSGSPNADFEVVSIIHMILEDPRISDATRQALRDKQMTTPLARVELANRSNNAEKFLWEIEFGSQSLPSPQYYTEVDTEEEWIGYFDLNTLVRDQTVVAKLTASTEPYPSDIASDPLELCPEEMRLSIVIEDNDNSGQKRVVGEELGVVRNAKNKFDLQLEPLGGRFEWHPALNGHLVGLVTGPITTEPTGIVFEDPDESIPPGSYYIRYMYPDSCDLWREVRLLKPAEPIALIEEGPVTHKGLGDEQLSDETRQALQKELLASPIACVELTSKSLYAREIQWTILTEVIDGAFYVEVDTQDKWVAYFDLNKVQEITVELAAIAAPFETSRVAVTIDLCPRAENFDVLIDTQGPGGGVVNQITLPRLSPNPIPITLLYKPTGGDFIISDSTFEDSIRGLTPGAYDSGEIVIEFVDPGAPLKGGRYGIAYVYPEACGLKEEVQIILPDIDQGGDVVLLANPPGDSDSLESQEKKSHKVTTQKSDNVAPPSAALLNRRRQQYYQGSQELGIGKVGQSAAFKRAMSFLMQPFDPDKLEDTLSTYDSVAKSLSRTLQKKDNKSKEVYCTLWVNTTLFLLDKLVLAHPTEIPEKANVLLKQTVSLMKKNGVKMKNVRDTWAGSDLKIPVVKSYLTLLK